MWTHRQTFEFSVFCLVISFLVWWLPEAYVLEQVYGVKGASPTQEALTSALQERPDSPQPSSQFECNLLEPREIRCQAVARNRSTRKDLSQWISQDLPSTLGWVDRPTIERRMTTTETNLNRLQEEQQVLTNSLAKANLTAESDDKVLREAQLIVTDLKSQQANRESQLNLLTQAIVQKKATQQDFKVFEEKQTDVARRVEELKSEIQEAERFLAEVGAPHEAREKDEARLELVAREIEAQQFALATWSSTLLTHSGQARVPDPDTFQLAIRSSKPTVLPQRSLMTLLWAPFLALLVFGWTRPPKLPERILETYQSPEEVEQATKWPCLGRL